MSTARSQNVESSYWIQVRRKSVWLLAGRVVAVSCMLLDCRLTIEWFLVLCCSVPCACARGDVWQIYFYQSRVSCWCNLDVTAVTSCPASCLHQLITDVHVCVSLPYGTTALHLALSCPVISIFRQLYLKPVIHISVGLTLKRAPRSYRMTPLDRNIDFLLVFYSITMAVSLTVSALQLIIWRNDLAGRLWPLNDSEGQPGSFLKWNYLETGPRPIYRW